MSVPLLTGVDSLVRAKERVYTVGLTSVAAPDFLTTGTSDQVAINAAIVAANAAGGGVVEVGPGTYDIASAGITMLSNVWLRGHGFATKLRLHNATVANVISGQTVSNVVISDMQIDGNQANNTDPGTSADSLQCNINLWNVNTLEIRGIYSHDAIFHGVFIRNQTGNNINVNIHHNWLYNNGYRALHIHGDDTLFESQCMVTNNVTYANGQQTLAVTGGNHNTGIFAIFQNMKFVLVANNLIHDELGYGLQVTGTNGTTTGIERCIVTGNIIANAAFYGMEIGNTITKLTVSNNVVSNSGSHGCVIDTITSGRSNSEFIISGNQFVTSTGRGLQMGQGTSHNCNKMSIIGNIISDNTQQGIYVPNTGNVANLSITGNVINNNNNIGIQMTGGGSFTVQSLLISGNQMTFNSSGAISLTTVTKFTISDNVCEDNIPSGGGSSASISLTGCSGGRVAGNQVGAVARSATGSAINIDSTSSDILVDSCNCYNGTGAPINVAGSNIRVDRLAGTGQINVAATASNCIFTDNRNVTTGTTAYLSDAGTNTVVRRRVAAPATATSVGVKGDEAVDNSYFYRATAGNGLTTGTWVRIPSAMATF